MRIVVAGMILIFGVGVAYANDDGLTIKKKPDECNNWSWGTNAAYCTNKGVACVDEDESEIKKRSDAAVGNQKDFEGKVRALRQYVHDQMMLSEKLRVSMDSHDINCLTTIQKLNSGLGGFCDQQADVFMHLAQKQRITTQMVWLYRKNYKDIYDSCHTIAEAFDGNRWVIVDPLYNLELKNNDGKMASREDVTNDLDIIRRLPNFRELEKIAPCKGANTEEWLEIYTQQNPFYVNLKLRGDTN